MNTFKYLGRLLNSVNGNMNCRLFSDYTRSTFNLYTLHINKQLLKMCPTVCAAFLSDTKIFVTLIIDVLTDLNRVPESSPYQRHT